MFLYHKWLELSINTRHQIASKFGIVKKGSTHVQDNVIQSDGYVVKDVELALSPQAIQEYLNSSEEDLTFLWESLIKEIENPHVVLDVPVITVTTKRTYVKKKKK